MLTKNYHPITKHRKKSTVNEFEAFQICECWFDCLFFWKFHTYLGHWHRHHFRAKLSLFQNPILWVVKLKLVHESSFKRQNYLRLQLTMCCHMKRSFIIVAISSINIGAIVNENLYDQTITYKIGCVGDSREIRKLDTIKIKQK